MPRIVDLSQEIYTGMMVYPGHLKTVLFDHASHAETAPRFDGGFSFQTKGFLMNDNGPTHVDSFSHLDPDPSAQTIDQMPLDLFTGDAVCVDVTGAEPRTDIPVSRVEQDLADPHDGEEAPHHALREPDEPRSGRRTSIHLHRAAAEAEGSAWRADARSCGAPWF